MPASPQSWAQTAVVCFLGFGISLQGQSPTPAAPSGLAAAVNQQRVTLTWVAPAGSVVIGYVVEAGSAPGLTDLAVLPVPASAPTFTTDGVPGGVYYVRVRAQDASAIGPASNEVQVTVSGPCVAAAPEGLQSMVTGAQVTLTWQAAAGGCAITGYRVEAGSGAGLSNLATLALGPVTSLTVQAPNGLYYVRVRALSNGTPGSASPDITVSVGPTCAPVLPLWSAESDGNQLRIGWGWEEAGPAVSSYLLTAGATPAGTGLAAFTIPGSARSFSATAPPGTYYLQLTARNNCGSTATQPMAVRFGRTYAGMNLTALLGEFTHAADRGLVKAYSTLGQWFSDAHADHGLLVWNYFARLFSRSIGPRTELYYTNDVALYRAIITLCGGTFYANARQVAVCWEPVEGIYRWVIIPYITPDFGTQLHELSHSFLYATYPGAESFPWIKEGSGMYYEDGIFAGETLVVDRPRGFMVGSFRDAHQRGQLVPLGDLVTRARDRFYNTPTGYPQAKMFWFYLQSRHPAVVAGLIAGLNARTISTNTQVLSHIMQGTGMTMAQLEAAYVAYALSW